MGIKEIFQERLNDLSKMTREEFHREVDNAGLTALGIDTKMSKFFLTEEGDFCLQIEDNIYTHKGHLWWNRDSETFQAALGLIVDNVPQNLTKANLVYASVNALREFLTSECGMPYVEFESAFDHNVVSCGHQDYFEYFGYEFEGDEQ